MLAKKKISLHEQELSHNNHLKEVHKYQALDKQEIELLRKIRDKETPVATIF